MHGTTRSFMSQANESMNLYESIIAYCFCSVRRSPEANPPPKKKKKRQKRKNDKKRETDLMATKSQTLDVERRLPAFKPLSAAPSPPKKETRSRSALLRRSGARSACALFTRQQLAKLKSPDQPGWQTRWQTEVLLRKARRRSHLQRHTHTPTTTLTG